jgi:peptide deformylase
MWAIKKAKVGDEYTIAFVDDRTNEKKMVLVNPDSLMQQAIDEIIEKGCFSVKEDYLLTNERYFDESRVVLTENEEVIDSTSAPWGIE